MNLKNAVFENFKCMLIFFKNVYFTWTKGWQYHFQFWYHHFQIVAHDRLIFCNKLNITMFLEFDTEFLRKAMAYLHLFCHYPLL